jgi:hypothetical protein
MARPLIAEEWLNCPCLLLVRQVRMLMQEGAGWGLLLKEGVLQSLGDVGQRQLRVVGEG